MHWLDQAAWKFFAVLAVAALASAALRCGWLVPGLILGAVLGLFFDTGPKSGTYESQAWDMVMHVAIGGLIGLAIGGVFDGWALGRDGEKHG
jgi:hypothetical protein